MNGGDLEGSDDNEQEDNLEEDAESGMDPALPRCSEVVKSWDIGSTMTLAEHLIRAVSSDRLTER